MLKENNGEIVEQFSHFFRRRAAEARRLADFVGDWRRFMPQNTTDRAGWNHVAGARPRLVRIHIAAVAVDYRVAAVIRRAVVEVRSAALRALIGKE